MLETNNRHAEARMLPGGRRIPTMTIIILNNIFKGKAEKANSGDIEEGCRIMRTCLTSFLFFFF